MEFFPTHLTPTLTNYLHQFLGSLARTGSLICQSSPALGVSHRYQKLCLLLDNICHHPAQVVLICSLCGCTGLPQTYYGGSSMSLNPGIVSLLSCPQVEVSRLVLGLNVSVQWVALLVLLVILGWNFHWDGIWPVHFLGIYVCVRWGRGSTFNHLFYRF